jgi:hypothetical protein
MSLGQVQANYSCPEPSWLRRGRGSHGFRITLTRLRDFTSFERALGVSKIVTYNRGIRNGLVTQKDDERQASTDRSSSTQGTEAEQKGSKEVATDQAHKDFDNSAKESGE